MRDKIISASLIYRKIEGKLSAVEEERFEAWLKEGLEHREYYERMRRMYQQENVQDVGIGGIQDVWEVFEKRVQGQRKIERKRRWMWAMSAAASVAIVLCCCLFVYYRANTEQKVNVAVQKIVRDNTMPSLRWRTGPRIVDWTTIFFTRENRKSN
ncbi:MAG: hypothetical protein ACLSDJ_04050 [Butyricimonas faecihominis]